MVGTGRPSVLSRVAARRGAALVVLTALVAGCVGAKSGSATPASPMASYTAIAAAPASATPSESPTVIQTESPTDTPFVTSAPTAQPSAVVDPLPNVPKAPVGTWKSIHWTGLPATPAFGANVSDLSWDPRVGVPSTTFQVFGWSHGYVGFTITAGHDTGQVDSYGNSIWSDPTLASSYSADGVHWHAGQNLAIRGETGSRLETIRAVVEGPAGLMAVGWTGGCASVYLYELWTSTDGKTWQAVDTETSRALIDAFAVTHVSGGAAGYVSVAYRSAGAWISKDGRNWQAVPLNTGPFANSLVNDGTAVTGGFVLAGLDGTPDCTATVMQPDDTPPPPPVSRVAAVWWSADGSSWTHISLPGAVSSSQYQGAWVSRLSEQKVLVVNGGQAWVSSNGRTWTPASLSSVTQDAIIAQGQHNLVVKGLGVDAGVGSWSPVAAGKLGLQTIDDNSALVSVGQTGDVPELVYWDGYYGPYGMVAVGPTGVVVTSADGSQLWFGTPATK